MPETQEPFVGEDGKDAAKPDLVAVHNAVVEAHMRSATGARFVVPIAAAPSPWRPIETAPKDGTRILMADASSIETGQWVEAMHFPNTLTVYPAGWEDDRYDADHSFEPRGRQPTHYMPLPAPPEAT